MYALYEIDGKYPSYKRISPYRLSYDAAMKDAHEECAVLSNRGMPDVLASGYIIKEEKI